eukprot:6208836-Pleurochrysis_carterae.AAC.1
MRRPKAEARARNVFLDFRCTRSRGPPAETDAEDRTSWVVGLEAERPLRACDAALKTVVKVDGSTEEVPRLKAHAAQCVFHMKHNLSAERAVVDVVNSEGGRGYLVTASSLPYSIIVEEEEAEVEAPVACARSVFSLVHVYGGLGEMYGNVRLMRSTCIGSSDWAMSVARDYLRVQKALSKPWRGQSWRCSTGDVFAKTSRSVEFGWSNFPGGSEKQLAAKGRGC